MTTELDVLGLVSDRLSAVPVAYMLTGSFALAYYATPRMTRDLDIVVALEARDVDPLVAAFAADFYVDADAARDAVRLGRLFNLMHLESGIKVDFIVRKSAEYRQVEFARRQLVAIAGIRTWIVSREDLILSKLVWALESGSELQRRDVRALLADPGDLRLYSALGSPIGRDVTARRAEAMSDTSAAASKVVADRHRAMTPAERWQAAASLYETARAIVESSLPGGLTPAERRLAVARRLYAEELSDAALAAHAGHPPAS